MSVAPKALAARRDERSLRCGPASSSRRRLAIVVVAAVTLHATATAAKGLDEAMRLSALHEVDFVR